MLVIVTIIYHDQSQIRQTFESVHVNEPLLRVIIRQNTLIQILSPKLNESSFEVKFLQSYTARSISVKRNLPAVLQS